MNDPKVIVGIGLSSRATREDVVELVSAALRDCGLAGPPDIVATRSGLAGDERLALGCPVVGVDDDLLVRHSAPVDRRVGLPARVAETAALLTAGRGGRLVQPSQRSSHVTVAVAIEATAAISDRERAGR